MTDLDFLHTPIVVTAQMRPSTDWENAIRLSGQNHCLVFICPVRGRIEVHAYPNMPGCWFPIFDDMGFPHTITWTDQCMDFAGVVERIGLQIERLMNMGRKS